MLTLDSAKSPIPSYTQLQCYFSQIGISGQTEAYIAARRGETGSGGFGSPVGPYHVIGQPVELDLLRFSRT